MLNLSKFGTTFERPNSLNLNHLNFIHTMKNWQKILAVVLVAALFILESCNRGYGCPGADL